MRSPSTHPHQPPQLCPNCLSHEPLVALPWARQAFAWYLLPVRPFLEQLYCDRCLAVFWRPRWLRWPLLPSLAVPEYSEAEEITLAYPAKLGGRGVARKRKMTG